MLKSFMSFDFIENLFIYCFFILSLFQISNGSSKRNSFTKENDSSVCCSQNRGYLSREVCLEKLPSPCQSAVRSPEHCPEYWPPLPALALPGSLLSSTSSSVDGHPNVIDVRPIDAEPRTSISFKTEDVESSQSRFSTALAITGNNFD